MEGNTTLLVVLAVVQLILFIIAFFFFKYKIRIIMNNNELLLNYAGRIDTATSEIAKDFKEYKDQAEAGNISEEAKTKAEEAIARLEGLGKENDLPQTEQPDGENTGTPTEGQPQA